MRVDANVTNRFAKTLVTSKLKNLDEASQEASFAVVLPESAYISGFVMEIDGKQYEAYIKEKEEAKKIYDNVSHFTLSLIHIRLISTRVGIVSNFTSSKEVPTAFLSPYFYPIHVPNSNFINTI